MIAVITIGKSGSSNLINVLQNHKLDVVHEPHNHMYPDELKQKYGIDIRVIFITVDINLIAQCINDEHPESMIHWVKENYKYLASSFNDINELSMDHILDYKKLYDSYLCNNMFSTLFIKCEKLLSNDTLTLDMFNSFLGTGFQTNDFSINDSLTQGHIQPEDLKSKIMDAALTSPDILINKIALLKQNKHYRLGDVVFHHGHYWDQSTKHILENDEFKETILRRYIEGCADNNLRNKNLDYVSLLRNVINDKIKNEAYPVPLEDELVIHLRLGDVCNEKRFLQQDYVKVIKDYQDEHKITKVTFCCAFHYGNYTERNLWIYNDQKHQKNVTKLTALFTQILEIPDIIIDVKSSSDIDQDIVYIAKSKHFVPDFGGFTRLMSEIRN